MPERLVPFLIIVINKIRAERVDYMLREYVLLKGRIVRGFVSMLARNECNLYDVQINNAKEQN